MTAKREFCLVGCGSRVTVVERATTRRTSCQNERCGWFSIVRIDDPPAQPAARAGEEE
jgi:hypothetical protein